MSDNRLKRLEAIASALSVGRAQRHIFLCADARLPRCASAEQSKKVWAYLKKRLNQLELESRPPNWRGDERKDEPPGEAKVGEGSILRSKVDCLRVCEQGPIAVVYPEGAWYRAVDEKAMERIIQEHLIGGRVVEELLFARGELRR